MATVGWFFITIGILLCLTIIAAPGGFLMILFGLLLVAISRIGKTVVIIKDDSGNYLTQSGKPRRRGLLDIAFPNEKKSVRPKHKE